MKWTQKGKYYMELGDVDRHVISKAMVNTTVIYTLWNKKGYIAHGQDLKALQRMVSET